MKKRVLFLGLLGVMFLGGRVTAEESMLPAAYSGSAELERVKQLAGAWEGVADMNGQAQQLRVEYQVISNNSAVVERLFPGTPHEMVSVYFDEGGRLAMTHYCALGNRPHLKLKTANSKELELEAGASADINLAQDKHMHHLKLTFIDQDNIEQSWTDYENGKLGQTSVFKFARVK